MRILMFLHLPFPPDDRVHQEALSLIKAGHEVKLLCVRRPHEPHIEIIDGIEVIRLRRLPIYIFEILVVLKALMLHRKWAFDVFHKHDLPMALRTGLILKNLLGIHLVTDFHENWPGMMESALEHITRYRQWVINNLKNEEKKILTCADRIIVVTEEHIDRLEHLVPGVKKRCVVVSNYANISKIESALNIALKEEFQGKLPDKVKGAIEFIKRYKCNLVYFGGLGRHRGIETLIEALTLMPKEVGAVIAGGNPERDYVKLLRTTAEDLGVVDRVFFTGIIKFKYGMLILKRGDICVIPYLSNPHTETTLPHKLFQCMYLEKPLVVSSVAPLKRIVTEARAGLCFKPGDSKALADAVNYLRSNWQIAEEMGRNGKISVKKIYNWENAAKILKDMYSTLQ